MKKVFHAADERGYADHGWLKAHHSFSFANWYDPDRLNFGKLRVLNDDIIEPGKGFGTHPHENMEIVTIPLKGSLAHKDNTGHEEIIRPNDVQVMSAGTGILHSEYNSSESEFVNLFQVWIFPNKNGHEPRYDQMSFNPAERKNRLQTIISPNKNDKSLWLNQDTYFTLCDLDPNVSITYKTHNKNNGVYLFIIEGKIKVTDQILNERDALGIWETKSIDIAAKKKSSFIIIEVPMK